MSAATRKMCFRKYHVLLLFSSIVYSHALNCNDASTKDKHNLKTIYQQCLKKQENRSSNQSRGHSSDDEWRDIRGHNPKSHWDRDGKFGRDDKIRDDGMYRDDIFRDDRTNYDRTSSKNYDRMGTNYERSGSSDRFGSSYDRMGGSNDRMGSNYDRMNNRDERDERLSRTEGMGSRNDMMSRNGDAYGRSQVSGRDDFSQNDEYGGTEMSGYNGYRSSQQSPRRFKREKRIGMNSGQRSQYNPNVSSRPNYDEFRNEDKNSNKSSSVNSSKFDYTACAMHCFLENLEMTGDNGMPDRYLVTHVVTKDVKNEDLRDFLQESIDECFQIINNEHTDDKCEYSKNLLMCLEEKGRANCDDWKDDMKF